MRLRDLAYVPMVELLRHLEAHGFTCFIASGGSRDFMRTVTGEVYGIPPERVAGSSFGLEYVDDEHGGSLAYLAQPDVFVHDDPAREFDYVKGAETALDRARREGWTVVSVKEGRLGDGVRLGRRPLLDRRLRAELDSFDRGHRQPGGGAR